MTAILFVCLGNICRSPAAEGVLRHLVSEKLDDQKLRIESCGVGDWHLGHLPDERMRDAAKTRGIILSSRAKQFQREYFDEFDYILAADKEVLNSLYKYAKEPHQKAKIHLITAFSKSYRDQEIPDPYYQGYSAFDLVLDMLEDSCEGLLQKITQSQTEFNNN